jgi:predicted DNA-binding transcriptional regulator AlpA
MDQLDQLLTTPEAADALRVSSRTLERHRVAGSGPRHIRMGGVVRYRRRDLAEYIAACARRSTSEPEAQS